MVVGMFAARLLELREKNNLSQQELADALGISRQSLSLYEKSERTINIDLLARIAEYFDVSTDFLLGLSDAGKANVETHAIGGKLGLSDKSVKAIIDHCYLYKFNDGLETALANDVINQMFSVEIWKIMDLLIELDIYSAELQKKTVDYLLSDDSGDDASSDIKGRVRKAYYDERDLLKAMSAYSTVDNESLWDACDRIRYLLIKAIENIGDIFDWRMQPVEKG